ncbi:OLC1v1001157C1 [Oldenlandia corymbosa var. corymbosa]|uniref:OLC1v1001157C1 n=1 Tax=Oldenlandia corymbosa var. corymbosa TaxID=529605 RepID=A0AAV1D7L5_OLDCO|nr:OLC1v1001157C1 [Oldenlandia corymbosa var. corymbosa]
MGGFWLCEATSFKGGTELLKLKDWVKRAACFEGVITVGTRMVQNEGSARVCDEAACSIEITKRRCNDGSTFEPKLHIFA